MTRKALVILSGGQDSTTCLFLAKSVCDEVQALSFNYFQRHAVELESAAIVAHKAGVKHETVLVADILKGTSPLVNREEQVETYTDFNSLPGGLEKTFVPSRNMLFLTLASNRAYIDNCNEIWIGVSQEDFGGYPDCRQDFINAMETAITLGLECPITLITPLIYMTKAETVMEAKAMPECWSAMEYTHTCYNGAVPPCGKCHACLLRAKGFAEAGLKDPLLVRLGLE
jgi:7-cyano-7-deazaguanine synthase